MFELSKDHEDFRKVVREFADDGGRAARRAVGPRAPLPGRPRARRWASSACSASSCPEEFGGAGPTAATSPASASRSRSSAGSTSRSASRSRPASASASTRSSPTAPRSRRSASCPTSSPGRALAASGSPSRRPAPTPVPPAPRRCSTATSGSSTAPRRSSPTPAPTSPRSSPSPPAPAPTTTARPEISARSWSRPARPGFTVEPAYDKLGWHASDTHGLTFDGLPRARPTTCSAQRGARLQAVPQDPRRRPHRHQRARRRPAPRPASRWPPTTPRPATAFGRPIGVNQGVAFPIADLAVMVEAARLLTYKAAWLKDELDARPALGRRGQAGRRDRQALLDRGRRHRHPDRHAGLRRQRLHGGVPRRPVLPRRQDPRDRRGHLRGAAHGHRPRPRACPA